MTRSVLPVFVVFVDLQCSQSFTTPNSFHKIVNPGMFGHLTIFRFTAYISNSDYWCQLYFLCFDSLGMIFKMMGTPIEEALWDSMESKKNENLSFNAAPPEKNIKFFFLVYISSSSKWAIENQNDVWLIECRRLDRRVRGYNSTLIPRCPFGSHRGSSGLGDCPLEALSEANYQKDRLPFLSIYRPFVHRQLCSHYHSPGFTRNLLDSISSDAQQNIEGRFAQAKPQGNWKRSCLWLPLRELRGGRWKQRKKMSRSMG